MFRRSLDIRINEARHVTWADVNFDKGQVQVRITKNGKARWVPFTRQQGFQHASNEANNPLLKAKRQRDSLWGCIRLEPMKTEGTPNL